MTAVPPRDHTAPLTVPQLRHLALQLSVTHDLDMDITDHGAALAGPTPHPVPWTTLGPALDCIPHRTDQLAYLHQYLCTQSLIVSLGRHSATCLRSRFRAMALPRNHPLHPGPDWVEETVPGGILTRGIGIHGVIGDLDLTIPLPPAVAALGGIHNSATWPEARGHAEDMATLMLARLHRDRGKHPNEPITLRPMGGVDVLALLGTARLRRGLAEPDLAGMRTVAAPTRTRAWVDVRHIDPVFVKPAAHATGVLDTGHPKVLLVTEHEVSCMPHEVDLRAFMDHDTAEPTS